MDRGVRRRVWGYLGIVAVGGAILLGLALSSRWVARGAEEPTPVTGSSAETPREGASAAALVPVTTVPARRGAITRSVPIAGVIRAERETQLAARMPARILDVTVREGDRVRPGQLLVRLDDREARAAWEVADAGVRAAQAALAKARGGATVRGSEIVTGVATAEAAVAVAQAKLEQSREAARAADAEAAAELRRAEAGLETARANLAAAVRGPRPEQRRQAETAVTQAEAAARAARRGLEEAQFLYDRGGLTRAQLEEARVADETAGAQLEAARAGRDLVLQGAAPEERQAAAAAVRQAEAGVDAARAGQRRAALASQDVTAAAAQLRQAEAGLRAARAGRAGHGVARADVHAAEAALEQARVQRRQAAEQVAGTRLASAVAGVVTLRAAEPGQIAQPGQPLLTVASGTPFFEGPVSGATVAALRVGLYVTLASDAAPGRRFDAELTDVPAVPGPDGRTYRVRAELRGGGGAAAAGGRQAATGLAPGVRARGTVQVAQADEAVLVPAAALQRRAGETIVWVARGGRAERRSVELGIETDAEAQVLTGIAPGDMVIVSGAEGLHPGDAVDAGGPRGGTGQRSEGARRSTLNARRPTPTPTGPALSELSVERRALSAVIPRSGLRWG